MLLLTRYPGETVVIEAGDLRITVTVMDAMSNGCIKLGFDAPRSVKFLRDNAIRRGPRGRNAIGSKDYEAAQQAVDPGIATADDEPNGNR